MAEQDMNLERNSFPLWWIAVATCLVVFAWSLIFLNTFSYPFVWDDLHLIRIYSLSELMSTFSGPVDPDQLETVALRPVQTVFFHIQASLWGENIVLQRIFAASLAAALLFVIGLVLRDLNFSFAHIVLTLSLFAASRVFTSLVLWLAIVSLIVAYIFVTLSVLFYLRWLKYGSYPLLSLALVFAGLAVFAREEAYVLPPVFVLLAWVVAPGMKRLRRPLAASLAVGAIVITHYALRSAFLPDAPQPRLSVSSISGWWLAFNSAWMPGGYEVLGFVDRATALLWICLVGVLAVAFIRVSTKQRFEQAGVLLLVAFVFSTPALAVPRSFGVALPSILLLSIVSMALIEVNRRASKAGKLTRVMAISLIVGCVGLGVGIGLKRSMAVAEALNENSVEMVLRDGWFLLEVGDRATIPTVRREAKLAHLRALGIGSRDDFRHFKERVANEPESRLMVAKYRYLAF